MFGFRDQAMGNCIIFCLPSVIRSIHFTFGRSQSGDAEAVHSPFFCLELQMTEMRRCEMRDNLLVEEADAVVPHCYIVVVHCLPLRAQANPNAPQGFEFNLDNNAPPLQFYRNLPAHVIFVGMLPLEAAGIPESDELAAYLLNHFSCSPVFLGVDLQEKFDGFCQNYILPLMPGGGGAPHNFNLEECGAFIRANTQYADRVCDILTLMRTSL